MKQIQLSKPGGLENLKLTDTETPSLKDNEVLLKVHARSCLLYTSPSPRDY